MIEPVRLVVILIVAFDFFGKCVTQENNVCPTFEDYYTIKNNTKCWYDLAAEFTAPIIIKMHGYDCREYKITTRDGYILTMFRIPSRNKYNSVTKYFPIYLQHGLLSTAANFVAIGRESLAFTLADAGHDVWLGNFRGNEYSEEHVNLTVNDAEYWEHTMDDIVKYDYPAIFEQIHKETPTGGQIIYIGHSLGTTLGLMYTAKYAIEAKHLFKLVILMSPAYTLTNMKSPYRVGAPFGPNILNSARNLELMTLLSRGTTSRRLIRTFCLESPVMMRECLRVWNLFYGAGGTMGPEMIPVYFNQLPGGTSLKIGDHAADLVLGLFRHYNHGYKENIRRYGTPNPPPYNIKRIQAPIYLVYSTADWATSELDAKNLYNKLPKVARHGMRRISERNFNHIDFLFTKKARTLVYEDLLEVIRNATLGPTSNINYF